MFKGRLTNRFCYGKRFLHIWGVGILHNNVSQILAIIDFFKERNYRENRVRKEEYYRQQVVLSLDRFGVGNYIPDCQSALSVIF